MLFTQKQMSYLVELPSMGLEKLQSAIGRLLQSRSEHGLNRVTYWGRSRTEGEIRKPVCREHLNELYQKYVLGSVLKTVRNGLNII